MRNTTRDKFAMISNSLITNTDISHGAFRVACYLLSRPDGWKVYNKDIQKQIGIKQSQTMANYWKELLNNKILFRRRILTKNGRFNGGYEYAIWERPDSWEPEDSDHNVENPQYGKSILCKTHKLNKTEGSNTELNNTESNDSNESGTQVGTCLHMATSKQDSMECDSQNKAKPKKAKPKRLKASQIDRDQYPHTAAAIRGLTISLKGHENAGQTHKFALSGKNRELTVAEDHLPVIEFNLSELARFHHLDRHQVVATLLNIYNERFKHRESCNLAVLAGVNLGMNRGRYGAEEMDYVEWVTDCELVA